MKRNLKVLGLTIAALFAMSVMAQAASATNFTAAEYPVTLHGEQSTQHVFTAAGGTVECEIAEFSGEGTAASETQTIHPVYEGCTAFGFVGATITGFGPGECDYLFHTSGTVDVVCESGEIVIDAGPCTGHIPAQTGLKSVSYKNEPAGKVTVVANVSGIHGTMESGFLCPATGGPFTNGTYTGNTIIEGFNSAGGADAIDVG